MKRRHPNHWKLDAYLQMKPLRHSPDKKVFTNLNDLLLGKEDWTFYLVRWELNCGKHGLHEPGTLVILLLFRPFLAIPLPLLLSTSGAHFLGEGRSAAARVPLEVPE
ncbi:hypothetical protein TNCV_667611 [Trichonephila clavipes]|nr:hypothetical protein TNCV_667611 [Trichonephila clavipes]